MPHALRESLKTSQPVRIPGDQLGTRRVTNFTGGYNRRTLEQWYGQGDVPPQWWDAQNIAWYDKEGVFHLCARAVLIDTLDVSDLEYLLYSFRSAVYRLPTANFAAAKLSLIHI